MYYNNNDQKSLIIINMIAEKFFYLDDQEKIYWYVQNTKTSIHCSVIYLLLLSNHWKFECGKTQTKKKPNKLYKMFVAIIIMHTSLYIHKYKVLVEKNKIFHCNNKPHL